MILKKDQWGKLSVVGKRGGRFLEIQSNEEGLKASYSWYFDNFRHPHIFDEN